MEHTHHEYEKEKKNQKAREIKQIVLTAKLLDYI